MKLGRRYEVIWLDHDETESKSPAEAVSEPPVIFHTCGYLVGITPLFYILAYNFEHHTSSNNDNMRILKKMVKKVKELK